MHPAQTTRLASLLRIAPHLIGVLAVLLLPAARAQHTRRLAAAVADRHARERALGAAPRPRPAGARPLSRP